MTTTSEGWGQWAEQAAAKHNAAAAMAEAIEAYRERCGIAATVKQLADQLYSIGDGSETDPITRIVKELWGLADEMSS